MELNTDMEMKGMGEAEAPQPATEGNDLTAHQEKWSLAQYLMARYAEMEAGWRISRGIAHARKQREQADVQGDQL